MRKDYSKNTIQAYTKPCIYDKSKKFFIFGLVLLMVFALLSFSGCSSNNSSNDETPTYESNDDVDFGSLTSSQYENLAIFSLESYINGSSYSFDKVNSIGTSTDSTNGDGLYLLSANINVKDEYGNSGFGNFTVRLYDNGYKIDGKTNVRAYPEEAYIFINIKQY